MTTASAPTLDEIERVAAALKGRILETPVVPWRDATLKLELFQHTGTFKLRGALVSLDALGEAQRSAGIAAMSGGNHAIAVSYAARLSGVDAKVIMPKTASPVRRALCERYGATVILGETIQDCFEQVTGLAEREGRTIIHPFEGSNIALGTATLGLEICRQMPDVEAVVVPIGGGGLAGGVAAAIKQVRPDCKVYGVEPEGAPSMYRSFKEGHPIALERIDTIADSLSAPAALPYSFGLCRRFVDEVVLVSDDALRAAMKTLFEERKLGAEPAGAAATAGYLGPLADRLAGLRTCVLVCGSNIDIDLLASHIRQAR